jgi:hypothetical protein
MATVLGGKNLLEFTAVVQFGLGVRLGKREILRRASLAQGRLFGTPGLYLR